MGRVTRREPDHPRVRRSSFGRVARRPSYERWWTKAGAYDEMPIAAAMTPGGFHAFEHRWLLARACRFHQEIGKSNVVERIHGLSRRLKEGLAEISHLRLRTPIDDELSAGIVCFEVDGLSPTEVVARLSERRIIAASRPTTRATPGWRRAF